MSDVATDSDIELAKNAKSAFDNHRYESCLSSLNKLLDARRTDGRVAHNRAVAQYLLSNYTLTDDFRKSLHAVSTQFDRDAENSGMEVSVSDKGVLLFNQALIHMRLHQNSQAIEILEQLFKVHNFLGSELAMEVCLMLTEVYITTYQLEKAVQYIEFIESELLKEDRDSRESEGHRSKLSLFKARLSLHHGNVKACKRDIKNFSTLAGNSPCAHFLKANMEYLSCNYPKALKMLAMAPKSPIVSDSGECLAAFYFNNIGCLHYHMGKYNLAAHYLRKAIEENDAALNGYPPLDRANPLSGRPLTVLGMNCRHVLLYNLGLLQLYGGHPLAAFDSLLEVVQVYHTNPRLWLRLAEACITAHANQSGQPQKGDHTKSDTVQTVFGSGLHRKLTAAPIQPRAKKTGVDSHPQSAAMPAPTLEFAAICLRSALFLLPDKSHDSGAPPTCSALPGAPITGNDIINLRSSILCSLAYVSLGLGDPLSALHYSLSLLSSSSHLPGGLKYLGHTYAAEALVYLDRVSEALQHLNPDTITNISISLPPNDSEFPQQEERRPNSPSGAGGVHSFPSSPPQAKALMLFNLATVFSIKKDYEKARRALQQASSLLSGSDILPAQFVLLSAYIELASGHAVLGLEIIKKRCLFSFGGGDKKTSKIKLSRQ